MTKEEALSLEQTLRLALEALETCGEDERGQGFNDALVNEAITAIKAALLSRSDGEAKIEPVVWNEGVPAMLPKQKEGETFIVSYEPKLEAKDEPVAWRDAAIRLGEELSSVGPDGYYDMDAKGWLDWAMEQNPQGKHSLPQRKPLTDEQAMDAYFETPPFGTYKETFIAGIRFIEAAHGIKGEA